jgi:hypothetical protein
VDVEDFRVQLDFAPADRRHVEQVVDQPASNSTLRRIEARSSQLRGRPGIISM